MSFSFGKIVGGALLLAGIGVIALTLLASYNIFTGKTPVPTLFSLNDFKGSGEEQTLEESNKGKEEISFEEGVQDALQEGVKNQIQNMFPREMIVTLLNLISWSIFAGIATIGGAQVSKLGIRLMK